MKKLITIAMACFALAACSSTLHSNGTTYEPKGLFSESEKSDDICYETSVGDIILGIIFIETVIAPVYLFGFDMYEPISLKKDGKCN